MLITLIAQPALALSCIFGVHEVNIVDGQEVPPSASIFLRHTYEAGTDLGIALVDAEGENVPVTVEVDRHHGWLTPVEPLAPGAYTLVSDDEEVFIALPSFTVVDTPDDTPPATPAITLAERQRDVSEWGTSAGIHVELAPVADASHYEVEIATSSDFSDALRVVTTWPSAFIGRGLCSDSAPDYDHGERYIVRARAIDVAGNASDWSHGGGPVTGCSSTGLAGSGLLVGLAALLGLARRRR
jgi:hypothetical protein